MKLKNKKTGEIAVFGEGIVDLNQIGCKNVAEMIEAGWEDYKEPKEYWTIDRSEKGGLFVHKVAELAMLPEWVECDEEYGIRFETEIDAKKAVEKLKAYKRLKDKGFGFESWFGGSKDISFWIDAVIDEDIAKDLDLLFGFGDEE